MTSFTDRYHNILYTFNVTSSLFTIRAGKSTAKLLPRARGKIRKAVLPRLRGWPEGRSGQPFYGWCNKVHQTLDRPFQRPYHFLILIWPLKRPVNFSVRYATPAVKRLAYLPFGQPRKRGNPETSYLQIVW
jgi:hypothetical protein